MGRKTGSVLCFDRLHGLNDKRNFIAVVRIIRRFRANFDHLLGRPQALIGERRFAGINAAFHGGKLFEGILGLFIRHEALERFARTICRPRHKLDKGEIHFGGQYAGSVRRAEVLSVAEHLQGPLGIVHAEFGERQIVKHLHVRR